MARTEAAHRAVTVRAMRATDLPAAKRIVEATGLFPAALLDDMAGPGLAARGSQEAWQIASTGAEIVGLSYDAPERMARGTVNLLLIAVHPWYQRTGAGRALMAAAEDRLSAGGARLLLVETSGLPAFAATRAFYQAIGYNEAARIADFYDQGDDKVVFAKPLGG